MGGGKGEKGGWADSRRRSRRERNIRVTAKIHTGWGVSLKLGRVRARNGQEIDRAEGGGTKGPPKGNHGTCESNLNETRGRRVFRSTRKRNWVRRWGDLGGGKKKGKGEKASNRRKRDPKKRVHQKEQKGNENRDSLVKKLGLRRGKNKEVNSGGNGNM